MIAFMGLATDRIIQGHKVQANINRVSYHGDEDDFKSFIKG